MKYSKLLVILSLAAVLTSCASSSQKHVKLNLRYMTEDSAPVYSTNKNAQNQIAEAATSVSSSLQELSAIELAKNPDTKLTTAPDPGLSGLTQIASISWNGPVEPIVRKIASAGHYRVNVLGKAPELPVLVNVRAQNETLATILRNVTYQAAPKASIKVYPGPKIIELRYQSN